MFESKKDCRTHKTFAPVQPEHQIKVCPTADNQLTVEYENEQINRTVQEMFEGADMWLVSEYPMDSLPTGTKPC